MLFLAAPEGAVYHSFFGKAWLGCQEISALQVQSQSWNSLNQRVSYSSCYGLRNSLGFSRFGLRLWGLWCLRLPPPVCCRVQELMSDDQREAGRIPRTIECELVQDLVDSCVPGDMVTITGVVKVASTEEGEVQQLRLLFPRMGFLVVLTQEQQQSLPLTGALSVLWKLPNFFGSYQTFTMKSSFVALFA